MAIITFNVPVLKFDKETATLVKDGFKTIGRPSNVVDIDAFTRALVNEQAKGFIHKFDCLAFDATKVANHAKDGSDTEARALAKADYYQTISLSIHEKYGLSTNESDWYHSIAGLTAYCLFPVCRGTEKHARLPEGYASVLRTMYDIDRVKGEKNRNKAISEAKKAIVELMDYGTKDDDNMEWSKGFENRVTNEQVEKLFINFKNLETNYNRSGIKDKGYNVRMYFRQVILTCLKKTYNFTECVTTSEKTISTF